ncbi:unnamed protein product [Schistosoma margrebowiei]|uniref:Uncharacterized protein n=1 Tax=Schistosoma margrebowiei TaxID=48269 RepID=A0AA84ZF52_9TREM|nr:unnamed protein product [Schistosoma margrebowiei]
MFLKHKVFFTRFSRKLLVFLVNEMETTSISSRQLLSSSCTTLWYYLLITLLNENNPTYPNLMEQKFTCKIYQFYFWYETLLKKLVNFMVKGVSFHISSLNCMMQQNDINNLYVI